MALHHHDSFSGFDSEISRQLSQELDVFAGRAALNGDRMPRNDDDTDNGNFAELHPDKEPPGEGGMSYNDLGRYALSAA